MILSNALKNLNKLEKLGKILDFLQKYGITTKELERLHDVTEGEQFGILSAYRGELSRNENKRRNTELVKYLNFLGTPWEQVQGAWPIDTTESGGSRYDLENAFFVYGIALDDLIDLATIFEQEAIVFKPTNETVRLINLSNDTMQYMIEKDIAVDTKRPREQEEVEPATRFRDTALKYEWSEPVSLSA